MNEQKTTWEQGVLEKLANTIVKEQRAKRRWGIFIKLLVLLWMFLFLYWMFSGKDSDSNIAPSRSHTALIEIKGQIQDSHDNGVPEIAKEIRKAFKDSGTRGIILDINSPGGSAVQSDNLFKEILYQRERHPNIKIYAVCQDVCASGAYYIAAATNKIYANPASLVGSIGALINGFGFVETMQKIGVTRRLIKSGSQKDFLDPFSPLKLNDEQHAQTMLDEVHKHFIRSVMKGRGNRLKGDPNQLYSGLVWTGDDAKKLGLIDGFGGVEYVAREIIKERHITNYTKKPSFFKRIAKSFGVSFGESFSTGVLAAITSVNEHIS